MFENTADITAILNDLSIQEAEIFGSKISEAQFRGYDVLGINCRPNDPYLLMELEDIIRELLSIELADLDPDAIENAAEVADDEYNAHVASGVARRMARAQRWLLGC